MKTLQKHVQAERGRSAAPSGSPPCQTQRPSPATVAMAHSPRMTAQRQAICAAFGPSATPTQLQGEADQQVLQSVGGSEKRDPAASSPNQAAQRQAVMSACGAVAQQQTAAGTTANRSGAIQLRARVKSFGIDWGGITDEQGKAVGFDIDFDASFSKEVPNLPEHAEFRQFAADGYKTWDPGHDHETDAPDCEDTSDREDDNYSRADDPDDYDDEAGTFESDDLPGLREGELRAGEYVDYHITLDHVITDTERNTPLAVTQPVTGSIKGEYPDNLEFTVPNQPAAYTAHNN